MHSILKVAPVLALVAASALYLKAGAHSSEIVEAAPPEYVNDVVPSAPVVELPPTDTEEPEPEFVTRMNQLHFEYGMGAGDADELDEMWATSEPLLTDDEYAVLMTELEQRELFFQTLLGSIEAGTATGGMLESGDVTEQEYYAVYSVYSLRETQFLIEQCQARRFRKAPFFPLPPSISTTSHPTAQLVPHFSPGLSASLIARLDASDHADLFHERISVNYLGESVMGPSRSGANAMRADTRASLQAESR